ncbi:TonB-dependent receptor [Dyella choica]|uniref:TonB-dependent receptor n=1 Tax=Dyella choica TaxID=1927959 RepID=A0A3S0RLD5_9GAMM|nr:TonB-dependent receptor [Dyella choica]RUL76789.1 TonB-dependent receptor [Dyella choica]
MKRTHLSAAIAMACCLSTGVALAQTANDQGQSTTNTQQRASVLSTSNTTNDTATKRGAQQLSEVLVRADSLSLGGGLMSVQEAPKAVSTITRDAIVKSAPGATFVQAIDSIPGAVTSTDDYTGLNDGTAAIRGYTLDEIGVTVNGAPINDSGNYKIYPTEYGDTENMGDITVQQGYPDNDMPIPGAAGGSIAWVTLDPSHKGSFDFSQSFGSNSYRRTFFRLNTGDLGPVRSWVSYSNNEVNLWRGPGNSHVTKVDAKSVWTIDADNTISAAVQYNREIKTNYESLTKAQAQTDYKQSYLGTYVPGQTNSNFYRLHQNPFVNYLASLDGEFKLSDNLHLSVVPYFQWGEGGGGSGTTFSEYNGKGSNQPLFKVVNYDLNGNGKIDNKYSNVLVNSFSYSYTYRPGVIAKLNQDFGLNNSLEYGVWYERPRQSQGQVFVPVDYNTGTPLDQWAGNASLIRYSNGVVQKTYDQYTTTTNTKVFVTDTWTPTDQLTLTGSIAYVWSKRDGFMFEYPGSTGSLTSKLAVSTRNAAYGGAATQTFHDFTPTFGAKYQLNEQNQFYLGYGHTFRAPINGAVLSNAFANYGANPVAVKPEKADTLDLGWRYYGDKISANVDAYASNFHNKQISGYDQNTGLTVYVPLNRVHLRGLNSEASYKLTDQFSIYGSYSYTQARLQDNINSLGDGIYYTRGKTMLATPKNLVYTSLNYNYGPFWAQLNAKYTGSQWGDWSNTEKVGGYTTFNFNAGWNFPDLGNWLHKPYIKVNVYNLADRKALTYASNVSSFLAANPTGRKDVNGVTLFASAPYYTLLQERTYMVTFGASFF